MVTSNKKLWLILEVLGYLGLCIWIAHSLGFTAEHMIQNPLQVILMPFTAPLVWWCALPYYAHSPESCVGLAAWFKTFLLIGFGVAAVSVGFFFISKVRAKSHHSKE